MNYNIYMINKLNPFIINKMTQDLLSQRYIRTKTYTNLESYINYSNTTEKKIIIQLKRQYHESTSLFYSLYHKHRRIVYNATDEHIL